jgi:hypothetical protein
MRELATVLIALAIVGASLYILVAAFRGVESRSVSAGDVENADLIQAQAEADEDAYKRQTELLSVALGVLGVVTGYFFGRVPAEGRARAAETHASQLTSHAYAQAANAERARQSLNESNARVDDARRSLSTVRSRLESEPMRTLVASDNVELATVKAELDALERRLR